MKTTVEISDQLLREARQQAAQEKVTLRALVERGLRHVLSQKPAKTPFRLRDASFSGKGLHPDLGEATWERIRALAYEDRGG